ncbi:MULTISPECIES: hypothetical protein [unclassified Ruegeria]|uniref:hypothetical protein n=1 Tax=unclassified Ruegeria TaxID=2625375 RepID=UPI0014888A04|nr:MULTISPECIES: hypothetical protein [unclassified Ruegeria]NOE36367.1 hypothetical protein [Ruegeria sp. HKCCD7318]
MRLIATFRASLREVRCGWWNFVSLSRDMIEQVKKAWKAADWFKGQFQLPPGDVADHIPITQELERTPPQSKFEP